jgi:L-histidine Nalpha-methyltransferase
MIVETGASSSFDPTVAADVRRGLTARPKSLPPYLLYDDLGSCLYERITELPEYYLTRAERGILHARASDIVARVAQRLPHPIRVVELGAGSASKTDVILRAVLARQVGCVYVPIDVSRSAIEGVKSRLRVELPRVTVCPLRMTHDEAIKALLAIPGPQLVVFIGSSIGNLDDPQAEVLLRALGRSLGAETSLLLGTDLRKSPDVLIPAYDDTAGVTAAFNKNVLARINRDLGGHFDLDHYRHVARWNEEASRIEMHLESASSHDVAIDALGLRVHFDTGETIHTESSIKYDLARAKQILVRSGFTLETTYFDEASTFAVHLARVRAHLE